MPTANHTPSWSGTEEEPVDGPDYGNSDYDTLDNWYEDFLGTDKLNPDTDGDDVTDSDEVFFLGTNPLDPDSDDDGWTDLQNFDGSDQPTADPDNDGIINSEETNNSTNPRVADTDGDGLSDGLELFTSSPYSPLNPDTDANGIGDYFEYYQIDPSSASGDGDATNEPMGIRI